VKIQSKTTSFFHVATEKTKNKFTNKTMKKIIKRDGTLADFNQDKIAEAIWKAAQSVGGKDRSIAENISVEIEKLLNILFKGKNYPTVEQVQDLVENMLIERQHAKTAKAYILYRQKQTEFREKQKAIIGKTTNLPLSLNALQVLERRYLIRNKEGRITESPEDMFRRVAHNIALADKNYGGSVEQAEEEFYNLMTQLDFMPNSPTLMNAGTDIQQLSACFVLPVEDSMEEIFESVKNAALIHKSGGGTGFSFSRLRPRNDLVKSTTGVSSGPLSFMRVFDIATDVIKQGGKRRGANMGILRVDHPDILDFITIKSDMVSLTNFNISVAITDKFMEALESNSEYDLINPRDGTPLRKLAARHVFDLIVDMAWKNGDPGVIFIDTVNKADKIPHTGPIESTNPCGEQPLKAYESCNLGSINLNKIITADKQVNWDKFSEIIHSSMHFLDNVIDMNKFPIQKIAEISRNSRKVGLGLMGFGDLLYQLKVPYNSDEGLAWANRITSFLRDEAEKASVKMAETRGTFPAWKGSFYEKKGLKIRNACQTTIAPTGTIGMIAEASGGIEPNFAISYIKNVMDGTELIYTNKYFEKEAREKGFFSEELMRDIARVGSIQNIEGIPEETKRVFVTAQDIAPEWHIRIQSEFQKFIDSAVSKTINFPHHATTRDIEGSYVMAYKAGCKGITVYRDGSRDNQVLNIGEVKGKKETEREHQAIKAQANAHKSKSQIKQEGKCPECEGKLVISEGCMHCPSCNYSACSMA